MRTNPNRNIVIVNNISKAIANKYKLLGTPFRINERGNFYLVDGQEVPQKDYEKRFPSVLMKISEKGENPNKRKQF